MNTVSLSGSLRGNVGKKDAKMHRKEFKVPCVMYGGKEQVHFVMDEKTLIKALHTPLAHIYEISIDGKKHTTIVQEVQYHPVTDRMLHADFKEVVPDKPVTIGVPIKVSGTAPGVLRGGKLVKKMRKLVIKALLQNLPDDITVSIDTLDIGGTIKVSDLVQENLTFLDAPTSVIVSVRTARAVVEDAVPGAEGAAAPAAAPAAKKA